MEHETQETVSLLNTESDHEDQATPEQASSQTDQQDSEQSKEEASTQDKQDASPEQVPERYEFKAVADQELDPEVLEQFSGVAKELGLTQDKAQFVLDKMAPFLQDRQAKSIQAVQTQWKEQAVSDKEFGGDKLEQSLAVAKRALNTYGSPQLQTLLNTSGIGNHPEVIRLLYKVGQTLKEDTVVKGGTATSDQGIKFYNNSSMR